MFNIDERLKGLPAVKEQVVQLYQSLNQPHLAIPGRKAGPAASFVLGLRGPSGFDVEIGWDGVLCGDDWSERQFAGGDDWGHHGLVADSVQPRR